MTRKIRTALTFRTESKAEPYRAALGIAGVEAVSFTPGCGQSLDAVEGLVLTGGSDVDPAIYGAARHPESGPPDRERDDYEMALIRAALERDIPVLAICRGMQLLNVTLGGSLIQHLGNAEKHRQKTGGVPVHGVALEAELASIFGAALIPVNSRHHQALDRLGAGLTVTARDWEDGVIEGVMLSGRAFAIGVQWHPEEMTGDAVQMRLFHTFAEQLRRYH